MTTAIVKYNAGNIESVSNALRRLGVEAVVTDSADELRSAERVIFPGVGEASSAMRYLKSKELDRVIASLTQPVLGICLGMQLLCEYSEENATDCLGLLPARVRLFESTTLKVPHMGWNRVFDLKGPLFEGVEEGSHMYFVHSYFVEKTPETTASCEYATTFSAALTHKNFHAVQFHAEKSGPVGARILENFVRLS